jgi:SAM-dependent methyltransferase
MRTVRFAVTTALDPNSAERTAAERTALVYGWPATVRAGRSLAQVAADCDVDSLLVLSARRVSLWTDGTERLWAPGMGELRLKRFLSGERTTRDGLLDAADLHPGDSVLDATLGLGMDALVVAGAVGPGGNVVGLEASLILAAMAAEGFHRHSSEASDRIAVVATDADAYLAQAPARSFDVVLFDPMFRHARSQGGGFDMVREFGDARPLTIERLERARHVARRWVVVKDGAPGLDLERLGLTPLPSSRGAGRLYARLAPL